MGLVTRSFGLPASRGVKGVHQVHGEKVMIRLLVVAVRWVGAAFACHANETYETLKQLDTKSGQHVICSTSD